MKTQSNRVLKILSFVCCITACVFIFAKKSEKSNSAYADQQWQEVVHGETAKPSVSSTRRENLSLPQSVVQIRAVLQKQNPHKHMEEWGKQFETWTPADVDAAIAEVHRITSIVTDENSYFMNYFENRMVLSAYSQFMMKENDIPPHRWEFLKALFAHSSTLNETLAKKDDDGCVVNTVPESLAKLIAIMDRTNEKETQNWLERYKSIPQNYFLLVPEEIQWKYRLNQPIVTVFQNSEYEPPLKPEYEPPLLLKRP